VTHLGARSNLLVVLLALTTMLGCSALDASQPAAQQAQMTDPATTSIRTALNPKNINFGNVQIGKTQIQTATLSNPGFGTTTITHATISGQGFVLTEPALPLVLGAKGSTTIKVSFTPIATGTNRGTVSLFGTTKIRFSRASRKNHGRGLEPPSDVALSTISTVINFAVSGVGMAGGASGGTTGGTSGGTSGGTTAGQLTASPAIVALGKVKVGGSTTQSVSLVNSGKTNVTVKQATVTGRGFKIGGLSFPLKMSPGQKKTFSVTFTPQSTGTSSGTVAVTTDASDPVVNLPVSGEAVAPSILVSNPATLSFGGVQAGQAKTLPIVLTNSGSSSVTVSQANVSSSVFTVSGLSLPMTLVPSQSASFSVTVHPQSGTASNGTLSVVSDASNGSLAVPLSAGVAIGGVLSTSDSSLDFSNVPVGSTNPLSETLTNTGGSTVSVNQANVTGTGFKVTGLSLPLSLSPGQSFTFGVVFTPTTGGNKAGSISVVSDASNPTLTISMVGTATVAGQLALGPSALNFGSVTVGQNKSMTASLAATGSSITITSASMSTSEFTLSGLSLPLTLAAGKSVSFTVNFAPQSSGTASASATFNSNASNSSVQESLTGSGTAAPQHSVALSWNASTSSSVAGYNVYRGVKTGGPYTQIVSMNGDNTFTDSSVQSGQTYFYVTTAVDSAGKESAYSNQSQAAIPTP